MKSPFGFSLPWLLSILGQISFSDLSLAVLCAAPKAFLKTLWKKVRSSGSDAGKNHVLFWQTRYHGDCERGEMCIKYFSFSRFDAGANASVHFHSKLPPVVDLCLVWEFCDFERRQKSAQREDERKGLKSTFPSGKIECAKDGSKIEIGSCAIDPPPLSLDNVAPFSQGS